MDYDSEIDYFFDLFNRLQLCIFIIFLECVVRIKFGYFKDLILFFFCVKMLDSEYIIQLYRFLMLK